MKRKLFLLLCALLTTVGMWAQEIGDQYVVGTSVYQITGVNLITNGSFDDGVNGWYNGAWTANSIGNSTVTNTGGYDDGAYITISAAGASATSTLRNVIPVESGKTYLFRCYTSGQIPSRANIGYSGLWKGTGADGHTESDQLYHLQWGERCAASTNNWTVNNYIFTPDDYTFVVIRSSWNANTKLDGFFIGEVSKVSDITETVSLGSWTGNASFNGSGQHWDGTSSTKYYDNASWWSSNTYEETQSVDLPAGAYVLKAAGRGAANDGTDTYISLDGNNLFFWSKGDTGKGIDTSGAENYSSDGTYANNNNGRGWEWRTLPLLLFEDKNGVTAKFGYRVNYTSKPSSSWSWAGICEPTLYKTELTTAMIFPDLRIAIAKGQKINDKNAGGSRAISDALSAAKAISLSSSVSDATTAYNALLAAIPIASDYAEKYALLDNEITKAAAMDIASSDISTAEAVRDNSSSTADQLVAATQNLKVVEYNYVTTNYPYGVSLREWTSNGTNTSAADFNNEHWSGTTHNYKNQNDSNGQGYNANSWSINFNQNVLLPAGTYVFKVAGRQAAGDKVTTSLVVKKGEEVLGSVNDFPRSNNSRGINKSGETDFEGDNSEFANGGKGYGWEWRYVKFTLDEESTVNIAVNAVATAKSQWVSFGDYTLQADNDDVTDILEYNVAKASAITVRDDAQYVNVTGSEKTALDNAISADPGSDYPAATTALNNAMATFIAAKSSYDAYASAKEESKLTRISANIGTEAFQYNETTNDDLYSAYEVKYNALKAYEVTSSTTATNVQNLVDELNTSISNYQNQALNAPDEDKAYYLVHAASGLAADLGTPKLNNDAALAYPVYFVSVEGNSYKISKDKSNYVAYAGSNDWTLNTTTTIGNAAVCTFAYIGDGKYSINSTKGAFGTDGTNANSSIYGNKAADAANSAWYIYEASANLKVNSGKLGTFIAPFAIKLPEHVKAYSATVDGTTVKLAKIKEAGEELPAGTPVIIYGDGADVNVTFYGNASVTENRTAGALVGILNESAKTVPAGSYVLQTQESVQAFYKVAEATPGVLNRCYLTTGGSGARLAIRFEDDATAISAIKAADAEAGALKDGKYLENGKIVIVKNGIKYSANGQILK